MYILHTSQYVHSRSEDLGKSPGGIFGPKRCEGERAAFQKRSLRRMQQSSPHTEGEGSNSVWENP